MNNCEFQIARSVRTFRTTRVNRARARLCATTERGRRAAGRRVGKSKERTTARQRKQRRRIAMDRQKLGLLRSVTLTRSPSFRGLTPRGIPDRRRDAGEEVGDELQEPALAGALGRKTAARQTCIFHTRPSDRSASRPAVLAQRFRTIHGWQHATQRCCRTRRVNTLTDSFGAVRAAAERRGQ